MSDLYFIRMGIRNGPVKIGKSTDVKRRLDHLQVGCPFDLVLIGTVPRCGRHEKHFHWKLRHHHMRGEWYRWKGIVPRTVEAALDEERWLSELKLPEPDFDWSTEDWRIGSPLYAGNPKYPQFQLPQEDAHKLSNGGRNA